MSQDRIEFRQRIESIIGDLFVFIPIIMVLSLPILIYDGLRESKDIPIEKTEVFFYCSILIWSILLNKDAYFGRSPGKVRLNLQVVDFKNSLPASPIRCLIRNLTVFVWPVEILMFFFSHKRRVGDLLAGTAVAVYTGRQMNRPLILQICMSVAVSWVGLFFFFRAIWEYM